MSKIQRKINLSDRQKDIILSALLVGFMVLFIGQFALAQPRPCIVEGTVFYDLGTACNTSASCSCNLYNASNSNLTDVQPNGSGWYNVSVTIYNYDDILTLNCSDGLWNGSNNRNCTDGISSLNVTVWTPEYPELFSFLPGFLIPLLIAGGLCIAFIRVDNVD